MSKTLDFEITILVVDDFDTMITILIKILKKLGFKNFLTAKDGLEAWNILVEKKVDFVISDWHMRNSGIDLMEQMQNSKDYANIPIIIISAEANETDYQKIMVNNTTQKVHFLPKPVTPAKIYSRIEASFD